MQVVLAIKRVVNAQFIMQLCQFRSSLHISSKLFHIVYTLYAH